MASERSWPFNTSLLISNGTQDGIVRVLDTFGFYVKQIVLLRSNTQPDLSLEVKRIDYPNKIHLGPADSSIEIRANVSGYLVVDSAYLTAFEQNFPRIKIADYEQSLFAREPIVAKRNILVDKYGNYHDTIRDVNNTNRLAVDAILKDGNSLPFNQQNPLMVSTAYEKVLEIISHSKWMDLAVYDEVSTIVNANKTLISMDYKEDGDIIGNATINFLSDLSWNFTLTRYLLDDDGSQLQDDDGSILNLD